MKKAAALLGRRWGVRIAAVAMIGGLVPLVPGAVNPAAAQSLKTGPSCSYTLHDTSASLRTVYDSWNPDCKSSYRGQGFHSQYYAVTTPAASGDLAIVVDSCAEVHLSIRTANAANSSAPFRATLGARGRTHLLNVGSNLDSWPKLAANTQYIIEVSALYAGQLGKFKLQYRNSRHGFTTAAGYCGGGSGTLKPPPRNWTCYSNNWPNTHQCLRWNDPTFWNSLTYDQQQAILRGDFSDSSVFAPATGIESTGTENNWVRPVERTITVLPPIVPDDSDDADGDGSGDQAAPPAEPQPTAPTADAGADFDAKRGEADITLSGSGTAHADGSQALTYKWAVSGASDSALATVAAGFLTGADSASAGFTVPRKKNMPTAKRWALNDGNWIEFTLTVTDGDGDAHSDTVTLTIQGTIWKPKA